MNIIAFTYDADIHCIDCTVKDFKEIMRSDREDFYKDSEGNSIHPVFSYDECVEQDWSCGDCRVLIKEAYSDPKEAVND